MDSQQVADQLKIVLATAFSLNVKAQNYHWNVTGPNFGEYHEFFADYYNQVRTYIDQFAEHIRQLGVFAPGSLSRFSELTKITDETAVPSPKFMFVRLSSDNQVMIQLLKEIHASAESINDLGLVATIEDALRFHSKMKWQLDAYADV